MRACFFYPLVVLLVFSCKKVDWADVVPPETPLFSRDAISYGVINLSFANLLENPGPVSEPRALVRKGGIVRVIERRVIFGATGVASREVWVHISMSPEDGLSPVKGWLRASAVDQYENQEQAKNAARRMTG